MYSDSLTIKTRKGEAIFYLVGLLTVYLVPTLSHLFAFPLYYLEPMRIIVILALLHSRKWNAYILALTLPMFSFLVAGHPVFIKMLLISAELFVNVLLFDLAVEKKLNGFVAVFLSILFAKMVYYALKFLLISAGLFNTLLIATPLLFQAALTILLTIYAYYVYRKNNNFKGRLG